MYTNEAVMPNVNKLLAPAIAAKTGNPLALMLDRDNDSQPMNPLMMAAMMGRGPFMGGVNPGIAGAFQNQFGPMNAGPGINPNPDIAGAFQSYGGGSNGGGNYSSGLGGDIGKFAGAIKNIESGSPQGNYSAVGPATRNGSRAYGAYQVMDFNIPNWTKEVLGRAYTPQEFLNDPEAQDRVFEAKFGSLVSQYGNPQDAASVWFSGRPMSGNSSSDGYTTVPQYITKFNAGLRG